MSGYDDVEMLQDPPPLVSVDGFDFDFPIATYEGLLIEHWPLCCSLLKSWFFLFLSHDPESRKKNSKRQSAILESKGIELNNYKQRQVSDD